MKLSTKGRQGGRGRGMTMKRSEARRGWYWSLSTDPKESWNVDWLVSSVLLRRKISLDEDLGK